MKCFEKGKFACPVHKRVSAIDRNGEQRISICLECRLDDRGICNGTQLVCENNHKRNSYSLFLMNDARYLKNIGKGNNEVLVFSEVLKIAESIQNSLKGGEINAEK